MQPLVQVAIGERNRGNDHQMHSASGAHLDSDHEHREQQALQQQQQQQQQHSAAQHLIQPQPQRRRRVGRVPVEEPLLHQQPRGGGGHLRMPLRIHKLLAAALLAIISTSSSSSSPAPAEARSYHDTNPVMSPCTPVGALTYGDAITVGMMLGGREADSWYHGKAVTGGLMDPCKGFVKDGGTTYRYAAFRPKLDALSLFHVNNQSVKDVEDGNSNTASLIVYARSGYGGANATVVSEPRYFTTTYGRIGRLTLVANFADGLLAGFLWKDQGCATCDDTPQTCVERNCVATAAMCAQPEYAQSCAMGVNIAFSGTDSKKRVLQTWYQVVQINKFSLSKVYSALQQRLREEFGSSDGSEDHSLGG